MSQVDVAQRNAPTSGGSEPAGLEPRGGRAAVIVLATVGTVIATTHMWGRWLQDRGYRMAVNAPPLTGNVDPRAGVRAVPALAVAASAVGGADRVAHTLSWRRLLWASFGAALAWSAALAVWDGIDGFTASPASQVDYLRALPLVDGVGDLVDRLLHATASLPAHVQAHPPGLAIGALWLERIGLATPGWFAAIEHVVGAAAVPAVLLATRDVVGEHATRGAAPFVAFSSIALTWSSGDAIVLGAGAWSVALLVLATGRKGRRSDLLALAGGAFGAVAMSLSYGIVLVGIVPAAVAWRRRRPRPVLVGVSVIAAAIGLAALGGFWWLDGLAVTREAYARSLARVRPYGYFLVANLAAAAIALGPAVWVGLTRLRDRAAWWLVAPAFAAIALADLSGLSKAEVERIWLPFLPWLVAGAGVWLASCPKRGRRVWLGAQVAWAVAVQTVVLSPW